MNDCTRPCGSNRQAPAGSGPSPETSAALEYLDGEPLSVHVARGPLPWRDVATFGIQVAGAVHALHAAGIIHRDLKPANIMLTTGAAGLSAAKLIDLGLARVSAPFLDVQDALFTPDPPERHQTQLGYPLGTPGYLPPEAGHCPADERLDVYSLGVTLYQLCMQVLPTVTGGGPTTHGLVARPPPGHARFCRPPSGHSCRARPVISKPHYPVRG